MFKDVTNAVDIHYLQKEKDFIDFNIQKLIPHKLSEYTPVLATGDLNNDGLDDIVIGGSLGEKPIIFFNSQQGSLYRKAFFHLQVIAIGKLQAFYCLMLMAITILICTSPAVVTKRRRAHLPTRINY